MGYIPTMCFRPKLEKTNKVDKLIKEYKLKKLIFSERAAFDRQLFDLSNFYQKKINKLKKNKFMTITITNKDGLNQISKFSENKIKHITQTNQWGNVIETILRDSNKENIEQSAVDFLIEELNNIKSSSTDQNTTVRFLEKEFNRAIEQAKEMEKQCELINKTNIEPQLIPRKDIIKAWIDFKKWFK